MTTKKDRCSYYYPHFTGEGFEAEMGMPRQDEITILFHVYDTPTYKTTLTFLTQG